MLEYHILMLINYYHYMKVTSQAWGVLLRSEIPSGMCAKLDTVAASDNKSSHAVITLLLLVRAKYMYGVVLHAHSVCGESHI